MMKLLLTALFGTALLANCASRPSYDEMPKQRNGHVVPFLIELHFSESWQQDLCYLVTYTPGERGAEVLVTGKSNDHYTLSLKRAQQIVEFAESTLLRAETGDIRCDDCTECEVLVRVDREHNFFVQEQPEGGLPPQIEQLRALLSKE